MNTKRVVATALTWDGVRLPLRSLPPKAQTFLRRKKTEAMLPSAKNLAELFTANEVDEIRICWVPQLRGGDDALAKVFSSPHGKRLPFHVTKTQPFGDILGVIYRR
jgi:hypothetical protein